VFELPTTSRQQLAASYNLVSNEFDRQRRYHKAITVWEERQNAVTGDDNATTATAETEDNVEWIDQFPQAENVDGDLQAADQVSAIINRHARADCPVSLLLQS